MAQIPDMRFSMRSTPGGLERLNAAVTNARMKVRELQDAVAEAQEALADMAFIVEKSKPQDTNEGS